MVRRAFAVSRAAPQAALASAVVAALAVLAACTEEEPPPVRPPWSEAAEIPGRRLEPAVAASGTRLVVAGGFSTNVQEGLAITSEVIALDTLTNKWQELPALPVAWTHGSLAASGGTLYLLGGLEGATFVARGEAFVLDPNADAWRDLPAMSAGDERGAAGVVVAPPHVYLVGGASTTGALASVLHYNLTTQMWMRLPDLPVPRSHPAVIRLSDGTLIVAGGLADQTGAPLGDVYALPLGAMAWEPRRPMPTPRGGCAYGQALGRLICAGGEAGSSALQVVEAYDPIADMWMELPELPVARAGTQGAVIGQQLYVPGGSGSLAFEPTSTVLRLSLIDALAQ